jgi:hypothetical protein
MTEGHPYLISDCVCLLIHNHHNFCVFVEGISDGVMYLLPMSDVLKGPNKSICILWFGLLHWGIGWPGDHLHKLILFFA